MPYSIEVAQSNLARGRYELAFEMFMDLAENELNADAQYALVKMCFDGHVDIEQAQKLFDWLNRETSLGNGYSFFNIGLMYERGLGQIEKNLQIAVINYEKATIIYSKTNLNEELDLIIEMYNYIPEILNHRYVITQIKFKKDDKDNSRC
jgi:tetratricopeptide (TPR) repeat protein